VKCSPPSPKATAGTVTNCFALHSFSDGGSYTPLTNFILCAILKSPKWTKEENKDETFIFRASVGTFGTGIAACAIFVRGGDYIQIGWAVFLFIMSAINAGVAATK